MNKKGGIGFPEFFILVVLITLPFLIIGIQNQLKGMERTIGDQQIPFIAADTERDLLLNTLDSDVGEIFEDSLRALAEDNGFFYDSCGGRIDTKYGLCHVINKKEDLKKLCFPDVSYGLNKKFSVWISSLYDDHNISYFKQRYPYELYVQGSQVRGIALKPITIGYSTMVN